MHLSRDFAWGTGTEFAQILPLLAICGEWFRVPAVVTGRDASAIGIWFNGIALCSSLEMPGFALGTPALMLTKLGST